MLCWCQILICLTFPPVSIQPIDFKFRFSKSLIAIFLVIFCTLLPVSIANSQQPGKSKTPVTTTTTKKLASEVLSTLGIDRRYDLYFDHALGLLLSPSLDTKFQTWMGEELAKAAGWQKMQDRYIAKLGADFSEAELRDLLQQSQQPALKKLLRTEIQVYRDTAPQRRKLLQQFWNDYNEGKIAPPPSVTK